VSRRFACLFPGQGSQRRGMGLALAEHYAASRELFADADRALGRPLAELCFNGSAEELALTRNTQPTVLAASLAAWRALAVGGLRPSAFAGHSLGEYSALVAAGTLNLADALRTVETRGLLMQQAVPVGQGAMAAILGLDAAQVAELCARVADGEVVSPANLNAPAQIVVSGHRAAVERAGEAALGAGAKRVVPLDVSAPFHCSLMIPAAEGLRPILDAIPFADPGTTVYANVTAAPVRTGAEARAALARQVAEPVRWCETIQAMLDAGIECFVEVGPGNVLSGLVRALRRDVPVLQAGEPAGIETALRELAA